ncbi:MAG: hypothetical protein AB1331_08315 [Bacillota bacterium]
MGHRWAGQIVQVEPKQGILEIWHSNNLLTVHPLGTRPGQSFLVPDQWGGLVPTDKPRRREVLAVQIPSVEVQQRSLAVYELAAQAVSDR